MRRARAPRSAWLLLSAALVLAFGVLEAWADPGPSLVMTIDPPTVTIPVCTRTVFGVTASNSGDPAKNGDQLRYVALTAVLADPALAEFVQPTLTNAWIVDAAGNVRWSGSVHGVAGVVDLAGLGTGCPSFTYRLPSGVALKGGERLLLDVEVHCLGPGDVALQVFAPATEDHHSAAPVNAGGVTDMTNVYYWPGSRTVPKGWYPSHNSLDPSDSAYPAGHSFVQHTWTPRVNDRAYAKAEALISQFVDDPLVPVTVEDDCFSEQYLSIEMDAHFTIASRASVPIDGRGGSGKP